MIKRYEIAKSLLFDNTDDTLFNKTFDIKLPHGSISFDDFANNNFEGLADVIGADNFNSIVKTAGFKTDGGFLNLYQGSDGLRLYYAKKGHHIFVFAFGEFQPQRYKVYLEGVWELQ
ncbi:hypothetical protein LX99_02487 [Mucilaginibacter oryzae]|uniref:Uncharacterized protein n=1 Tax=Mucilaginibacter oryzae TaxID=468058 RepID=A0A316HCA8_9SPHI|nr:hypothetical protein [Mucilaginibacter oryzae]PWK77610.1 hypothetical protein LX99_02487 [Mucilaginibacter oryzae]